MMRIVVLISALLLKSVSAGCKNLDLPWASYSGVLQKETGICLYSNVRFAQPPTKSLRFQKPRWPSSSDPPAPSKPVSCFQIDGSLPCVPKGDFFSSNPACPAIPVGIQLEDCLFLDLYVPLSVFNGKKRVPVAVWFLGGAYLYGSKHDFDLTKFPLYSGQGVLESTQEPLIFVSGNYRLGAYGWLAGSYVEEKAQPNAGLYDQRMILQFVQKYIYLVNGDGKKVSVWGESSGAGSIIHHLIAQDGRQDPLFSTAVLQSPAFEWKWDRSGDLNNTYNQFAAYAGCENGEIHCLQAVSTDVLQNATLKLYQSSEVCTDAFTLGPSLDGNWIRTLPPTALHTGKYWKGLNSIMISHVKDEVPSNSNFLPYPLRVNGTVADFDRFLSRFMPQSSLKNTRKLINETYSSARFRGDQKLRAAMLIRDSIFTCNTRNLFDAYHNSVSTWMINYNFFASIEAAFHASDLIPLFSNQNVNITDLLEKCTVVPPATAAAFGDYVNDRFAPAYQSYLKSYAIHGDPNVSPVQGAAKFRWPTASTSSKDNNEFIRSVLQPYLPQRLSYPPFELITDKINHASVCDFWTRVSDMIMQQL